MSARSTFLLLLLLTAPSPLEAQVCDGRAGLLGDVTGDERVDIRDAQQVARFSVGLSVPDPDRVEAFGDVNQDGGVDILDAQLIARHAAGLKTDAPIAKRCEELPTVEIAAPSNGTAFAEEEEITFEGSATDPEDGSLAGESLVWKSDVAGQIGTGEKVIRSTLSVGEHTITLTATDSDGNSFEGLPGPLDRGNLPAAGVDVPLAPGVRAVGLEALQGIGNPNTLLVQRPR